MEAAKSSVKKFISKDGHHDTTIHEQVAPAVQQETINRTQHEQATTAVDREVHQDHYHTTEQPVYDKQTLPEQHHHNLLPTQERSYEHDDADKVKQRLAAEQSKYKSTQTKVEGEHSSSIAPSVAGEHVHHHVHETVQPVVQKQTVEPHVIHTTQPIHEVHHNSAQHHASTALPAVSMDEFKKQGGSLEGRETRHGEVNGCPPEDFDAHRDHDHGHDHKSRDSAVAGLTGAGTAAAGESKHRSGSASSSDNESKSRSKIGAMGGAGAGAAAAAGAGAAANGHKSSEAASYGNDMYNTTSNSGNSMNSQKKASLMDKLNPKKDANGDGVPGFMK